MERMNWPIKHLVAGVGLLLALFLVGCNGGGDDVVQPSPSPSMSLQLTKLDAVATAHQGRSVVKDGAYVYVGTSDGWLLVFNVVGGDSLVEIASLALNNSQGAAIDAFSMVKVGNYLYISAIADGVLIVDVTDPTMPNHVAQSDVKNYSATLNDNRLYVSADDQFIVYDVSDPSSPTQLGRYASPYPGMHASVIDGDFAYVSQEVPLGLATVNIFGIFDIADPSSLKTIGAVSTLYSITSMAMDGDYLLVAEAGGGINIYNGHNTSNFLVSSLNTTSLFQPSQFDELALQTVVQGHYAFMADGPNGIAVIDIQDVVAPRLVARVKTGVNINGINNNNVTGIAVDGDLLVAADDSNGVYLFRISEVQNPVASSTNRFAVIQTSYGLIKLELREDLVPLTTNNFIRLAQSGYYNGLLFHRVIAGFMIQSGDPNGNGTGGPGYTIPDEFPYDGAGNLLLKFDQPGILAMANTNALNSGSPDSGGSQFFITVAPEPGLDGGYTVFGRVVEGLDVVQAINAVETICPTCAPPNDKPINDVVIESVTITTE